MRVLGVNGGNGVMLHALKNDLIANIEVRSVFHTPQDIQWKSNFSVSQLKESKKFKRVDIIVGHPDCGHSSVLSYSRAKKLTNPKENKSFNLYIRQVKIHQPKLFFMENLTKMLDNFPNGIQEIFPGYRIKRFKGSVSRWGNSQFSRKRVVIVGIREDLDEEVDRLIKFPSFPENHYQTCVELSEGLGKENIDLCHVREEMDSRICLYHNGERNITCKRARRLWLTDFADKRRWPVEGMKFKNQPGVYRNLAKDYPKTVRKQNRQFNHWGLMLTPREIARIQGIPDDFVLWYNPNRKNYAINKARTTCAKTPPYEIGTWIKQTIDKIEAYVCNI